jgi:2-dehydro-3-deoxyphosphogalactonate aldolase
MNAATPLPLRLPLIAILRGISPLEVLEHVEALVDEGYDAIEIPLNSPQWIESIAMAQRTFGMRAAIGAGTVLREDEADSLAELGVPFIVTPNTRPALIAHAVARGLQVVAGCATVSEAFAAIDAGAQMLKLFPAGVYGPQLVRAWRAVLPPLPLFAVGGVTPETLKEFVAAGSTGAGIGGELYRAGQPVERTRQQARAFRQAYLECSR